MSKRTVSLSRPITAHGESVTTLELGEPTLAALDGVHLDVRASGDVRLNLGELHLLVAALADIPPSSARQIALADLRALLPVVTDFFDALPATGES